MASFSEIINYTKSAKEYVQSSSILNPLARGSIKSIPIVGEILLEMWDQSTGSNDDKLEQIRETLNLIIMMDEENFDDFKIKFQENQNEIIQNRDLLNQILFEHYELLKKINKISGQVEEIESNTSKIPEIFHMLKTLSIKMSQEISDKDVPDILIPDKVIDIPEEFVKQIIEKEKVIESLKVQIEQVGQELPEEIFEFYQKEANALYYSKNYKKALKVIEHLVLHYPHNPYTWSNKGVMLSNLGKYQDAMKCYYKALRLDRNNIFVINNAGALLAKLGQYQKAIKLYDIALLEKPNHVLTLQNKGASLDALRLHEDALQCFDKALEEESENISIIYNKGVALGNLGKTEEAMVCYNKVLKLDPQYMQASYNMGFELLSHERYQEALKFLKNAYEQDSSQISTLHNIGACYHNLGKQEEAIEWYDKTLEKDPRDLFTLQNKAKVLRELGRYQEAIEWYDKALKQDPNDQIMKTNRDLLREELKSS